MVELNSPIWTNALAVGLGAKIIAVEASRCIHVSIFRLGPFQVAYADFPVGSSSYPDADVGLVLEACRTSGADITRFHSSAVMGQKHPDVVIPLGTTQIVDLQEWDEAGREKSRRTRNRAKRSEVSIEGANRVDGGRLHELYVQTLGRHAGKLRYSRAYFDEIAEPACTVAKVGGDIIGFVAYGSLEGRAYYLHGGHDPAARAFYPSDLLFRSMLLGAKASGARSFDFLPSPRGQESLDHYKQSWGGVPSPLFALDYRLSPLKAAGFSVVRKLADYLPPALLRRFR